MGFPEIGVYSSLLEKSPDVTGGIFHRYYVRIYPLIFC